MVGAIIPPWFKSLNSFPGSDTKPCQDGTGEVYERGRESVARGGGKEVILTCFKKKNVLGARLEKCFSPLSVMGLRLRS